MLCSTLLFVVVSRIITVEGDTVAVASNQEYLGSKTAKAYHFPWMVSIHKQSGSSKEFIASGSILTGEFVVSSMDSFVRNGTNGKPYYQQVGALWAYSGGIWGTPYIMGTDRPPEWFQKRKITEIWMFSDPDVERAGVAKFLQKSQPKELNSFKRSPFGFSMSVCLLKVGLWLWKRSTLPMPLVSTRADQLKLQLEQEVAGAEKASHRLQCFVGGWRLRDKRLVQHEVVYVPLSQCKMAYCGYDQRACLRWPVRGVHVCFKSLTFTDVCWRDQGSALFCQDVSQSVIAVLTSGPTCGHRGLPGVYTLVQHAMELFERIPSQPYSTISDGDAHKYTPPPQQSLFPAYR